MPDPGPTSNVSPNRAVHAAAHHALIRSVFGLAAARGLPIWLVGGSVRDLLLGVPLHDLDFAVDGDGLAIARSVADHLRGAYVPLDRERRTGRAILAPSRTEPGTQTTYLDFAALRGPNLEADLRDRDFTLNAIALAREESRDFQVVDPLGGVQDLADGVLRAPMPHAFASDPVRTLRAVRMQAQFEFTIEPQTWTWLQDAVSLLPTISAERIRDEWFKILQQPAAASALRTMYTLGLLHIVVPPAAVLSRLEADRGPSALDLAIDTVGAVEHMWSVLPDALRPVEGWIRQRYIAPVCDERSGLSVFKCAALLHNAGRVQIPTGAAAAQAHAGGKIAEQLARMWHCSSAEARMLGTAIREHVQVAEMASRQDVDRRMIYRFFKRAGEYGVDAALVSLAAHQARHPAPEAAGKPLVETAARLWQAYFEQYSEIVDPPLLLSGEDLIRLGVSPGPEMGTLLARLQEAQATGEIETRQQALAQIEVWANE